jgi:hypothetical protein
MKEKSLYHWHQGGSKAGDKDLKEKRKLKKKAAESRIKVLGEALGHVDDEDGVLVPILLCTAL